jgi:hypothetical protein
MLVWNTTTKTCEIPTSNNTDNKVSQTDCAKIRSEFNETSKKCEPCPLTRPAWNETTKTCQNCTLPTPIWNITTAKCQSCPS